MNDHASTAHWARVDGLLDQLLTLAPSERAAFIGRETCGDERLRDELLALSAQFDTRGDLLDRSALSSLGEPSECAMLQPGRRIGAYRVLALLGRGGMGEVYRSERADGQFEQQVALKVLRRESVEHLGRFLAERRILARLEHPGIARLYDAGITDGGRPYMVMELVEGLPIAQWCHQHRATLRKRIDLFLQVCDAVAYAHQHLIIHRDLKPDNVLVMEDGRAKLLDFGVAKLLSPVNGDETFDAPLTPSYAAPEQLTRSGATTATDVHALGLLLYELLTGQRPWGGGDAPIALMLDRVLREDAPTPSRTAARSPSPPVPVRSLRGDLDAIVAKALRKQPVQRYPTVIGLKADLCRHLRSEPVAARGGAWLYVMGRFVRRYRWAAAGVLAVFLALAAGLVGTTWQAHRAEREAQTSKAVQEFVSDLFRANASSQSDPVKARQTTARELLDIGARKMDVALTDAPAAKLGVLKLLASLYEDLAVDDEAVRLLKQAVILARHVYGPDAPEVAEALIELGMSMHASSAVGEAETIFTQAATILDRRGARDPQLRAQLMMAQSELYASSDAPRALALARKAVKLYQTMPASTDLAEAMYQEGVQEAYNAEPRAAVVSLTKAVAIARALDDVGKPSLPRFYAYLGEAQQALQDFGDAVQSGRLALRAAEDVNGEEHVDTLQTRMRLGRLLFDTGHTREGLESLRVARGLAVKIRGVDDQFHTPQTRLEYGYALVRFGDLKVGMAEIEAAIANRRKNRPGTIYLATMLEDAAFGEYELGRADRAAAHLDEAAKLRETGGQKHASTKFRSVTGTRIRLALAAGQAGRARTLLTDLYVEQTPAQKLSASALDRQTFLAEIQLAQGNIDAAAASAATGRQWISGSGLGRYLRAQESRLDFVAALALLRQGHAVEADALLRRVLIERESLYSSDSPRILETAVALGECALALGNVKEGRRWAARGEAIVAAQPELGPQYLRPLHHLLAARALVAKD